MAGRVVVLLLVGAVLASAVPMRPGRADGGETLRFYTTAALVDHGTFAIEDVERTWGPVHGRAKRAGHAYGPKAPGTSFLGVLPYVGYRLACLALHRTPKRIEALWTCRTFAVVLPALFFVAFFGRFLDRRETSPAVTRALVPAVAIGSAFFAYATGFVPEALAAASAFAALGVLAYLDSYRAAGISESPWLAGWAGFFATAAAAFAYAGIVATVALAVYALFALRPRSRLLWFGAGALPPVALVLLFHWRAFGGPFTTGHWFVANAAAHAAAHTGLLGIGGFDPRALRALFEPGRGIFLATPLLLAAPVGFVSLLASPGERRPAIVAFVVVAAATGAGAVTRAWNLPPSLGPREAVIAIPFLAWAAAAGWDALARPLPRVVPAIVVGLGAAGLVASGLALAARWGAPTSVRTVDSLARALAGQAAPVLPLAGRVSLATFALAAVVLALSPLFGVPGWGRRAGVLALAALFFACAIAPLA